MGFLEGIFTSIDKATKKQSNLPWIPLTNIEQLDTITAQSNATTVIIFKHSTRCGISSIIKKQFENAYKDAAQQIKFYYLDLLNYRAVSNEIALQFKVAHQSPQLIVLKNESVVANASHYEIMQINLEKYN